MCELIAKNSATVNGKSESTTTLNEADEAEKNKESDKDEELKKKSAKNQAITIDADWLKEYGFEVVVHEKFVPPGVLHASRISKATELPAWDPMGALLN